MRTAQMPNFFVRIHFRSYYFRGSSQQNDSIFRAAFEAFFSLRTEQPPPRGRRNTKREKKTSAVRALICRKDRTVRRIQILRNTNSSWLYLARSYKTSSIICLEFVPSHRHFKWKSYKHGYLSNDQKSQWLYYQRTYLSKQDEEVCA